MYVNVKFVLPALYMLCAPFIFVQSALKVSDGWVELAISETLKMVGVGCEFIFDNNIEKVFT